jgi:hypothetical protein
MQEYCKSDKGRRRRLDRANASKRQKQQGQWDTPKGWRNYPPKQSYRQVNNVMHPPIKTKTEATVDTKGAQERQGTEAPTATSTTSRGRQKVFLLALWDQCIPPHASVPFGNQEEDRMGS